MMKRLKKEDKTMAATEEKPIKLRRRVDLFSGIALIVGTMIGNVQIADLLVWNKIMKRISV